MRKIGKSQNCLKGWSIKLQVSPEEEKKIRKEAIDNDMRVAEYIKVKVLGDGSNCVDLTQGKSA